MYCVVFTLLGIKRNEKGHWIYADWKIIFLKTGLILIFLIFRSG